MRDKEILNLDLFFKIYLLSYISVFLFDRFFNGIVSFYLNDTIFYFLSILAIVIIINPKKGHLKNIYTLEIFKFPPKTNFGTISSWLFFISLSLLILHNFLYNFPSDPNVIFILKQYEIIGDWLFYTTILLGIISFFVNKRNWDKEIKETSDEENKTLYILIICALTIAGAILRYFQVFDIGQSVDSFFHTVNALNLTSGGENFYNRGQLYTYLITLSYKIFGVGALSSHLIDIIFSSLTIPLIYFVGQKIFNRDVGIISATLLTFSFWHIGEAGNIRMYTLLVFFSLLLFLSIHLVFFKTEIFSRRAKSLDNILKRKWAYFLGSSMLLAISFHLHSVIAAIFLPILLFLITIAFIFIIKDTTKGGSSVRTDNVLSIIMLIVALFGSIFLSYPSIIGQFDVNFTYNNNVIQNWNVLSESLRNNLGWFLNLYGSNIFYLVLILSLVISFFLKKMEYFFVWFLFTALWLENLFLLNRYFSPRYVIFLLPLFILLIGFVLYYSVPIRKNKIIKMILFIIFIILINPWSKMEKIIGQKFGENYNQEIYYDFKGVINSIPIKSDDILIETSFGPFDSHQKTSVNILNISRLTSDGAGNVVHIEDIKKTFLNTINNKHGWFLTDYYRFEKWSCEEYVPCDIRDFILNNPQIFKRLEYPKDPTLYIYEFSTLQCAPSN